MQSDKEKYSIVYCLPALYLAGGMERVLTTKANYMAEHFGYDITIILTDGKDKPFFYPLSPKIKVINLNIGFEELWNQSFLKKVFLYLQKQYRFKKELKKELMRIRPDFTVSMLRREINFINSIHDGSRKIGEIHINREHYRTFEGHDANFIKKIFSQYWQNTLLKELRKLDSFVVLTENDKEAWTELNNVSVIPNPISFTPAEYSPQTDKRVIAVGRYCHEKGYDKLLSAWSMIQNDCPDWSLVTFGDGERAAYNKMMDELGIDRQRCILNGRTSDIESEFVKSSLAVCSSRFEGFGLVIVEAMACGLPVVSFDCPWGPRSIITNGEDGLLVEDGNTRQLADAMLTVIHDDDKRKQMGAHAAENIRRFSVDSIANEWKKLFDEIYKNKN